MSINFLCTENPFSHSPALKSSDDQKGKVYIITNVRVMLAAEEFRQVKKWHGNKLHAYSQYRD